MNIVTDREILLKASALFTLMFHVAMAPPLLNLASSNRDRSLSELITAIVVLLLRLPALFIALMIWNGSTMVHYRNIINKQQ